MTSQSQEKEGNGFSAFISSLGATSVVSHVGRRKWLRNDDLSATSSVLRVSCRNASESSPIQVKFPFKVVVRGAGRPLGCANFAIDLVRVLCGSYSVEQQWKPQLSWYVFFSLNLSCLFFCYFYSCFLLLFAGNKKRRLLKMKRN